MALVPPDGGCRLDDELRRHFGAVPAARLRGGRPQPGGYLPFSCDLTDAVRDGGTPWWSGPRHREHTAGRAAASNGSAAADLAHRAVRHLADRPGRRGPTCVAGLTLTPLLEHDAVEVTVHASVVPVVRGSGSWRVRWRWPPARSPPAPPPAADRRRALLDPRRSSTTTSSSSSSLLRRTSPTSTTGPAATSGCALRRRTDEDGVRSCSRPTTATARRARPLVRRPPHARSDDAMAHDLDDERAGSRPSRSRAAGGRSSTPADDHRPSYGGGGPPAPWSLAGARRGAGSGWTTGARRRGEVGGGRRVPARARSRRS